jgi:hypothetical protein
VRKFITLILISALALVFTQCSVKPSKRTHGNAIGIWVGTTDVEDVDKLENWAVGINLKHLNPKKSGWDFFRPGTNTSLNVNSGIHFGKSYGMSVDASYHILTDDLEMMGGSAPFQFYIGPSLGADLISKNGKPFRFNPKFGASGGGLVLFSAYGKYPESDLSLDGMIDMKNKIFKNDLDFISRIMYNLYLF